MRHLLVIIKVPTEGGYQASQADDDNPQREEGLEELSPHASPASPRWLTSASPASPLISPWLHAHTNCSLFFSPSPAPLSLFFSLLLCFPPSSPPSLHSLPVSLVGFSVPFFLRGSEHASASYNPSSFSDMSSLHVHSLCSWSRSAERLLGSSTSPFNPPHVSRVRPQRSLLFILSPLTLKKALASSALHFHPKSFLFCFSPPSLSYPPPTPTQGPLPFTTEKGQ